LLVETTIIEIRRLAARGARSLALSEQRAAQAFEYAARVTTNPDIAERRRELARRAKAIAVAELARANQLEREVSSAARGWSSAVPDAGTLFEEHVVQVGAGRQTPGE
jgi:hypothetical protein